MLDQLHNTFGKNIVAFEFPIIENEEFVGYVDILSMKVKNSKRINWLI